MPSTSRHFVTTAQDLPGYEIVRTHGLAQGLVVRSRSIIGNILGAIESLFGGNITVFQTMCERARLDAYNAMLEQVAGLGGNAVIGVRYDATEIMAGLTEVLCYGTAVTVKPRAAQVQA